MNKSIAKRAFSYLKPYLGRFWIGQVATLAATAAGLVFPLITRHLVDTLLVSKDLKLLFILLSILAGVFVVMMAAGYLKDIILGKTSQYITRDIRQQVFEKLQTLKVSYFEKTKSGEIVSIMTNDINRFQESISQGLVYVISQLVSLAAVLFMLVKLDAPLSLILVGLLPFVFFLARIMGRKGRKASRTVQEQLGAVTSFLSEAIRGIDVIKTFVLDRLAVNMFKKENDKAAGDSVRVEKIKALNTLLVSSIGAIFMLVILGLGSWHVFQDRISTGDLIAYIIYVQMIVTPLGMLSGIWMEIQKSFAAAERIFTVLDTESEETARSQVAFSRIAGRILEFKDVTFGYQQDAPVLSGISLSVESGETIALAGPSGAGKSSLVKLILKFYGVQKGSIEYLGQPLSEFDPASIRNDVAVVMQDTHLFDMTVKENILCGSPKATERQVMKAAKQAGAHEFIAGLADGYDTQIGENGVLLSGGQRQRIAISRAFLKDPRMLLLDEATSSLDTESEQQVGRALKKLMKGRTTIIISHRLSTIKNADRIYVVDNGKIVSCGSHTELENSCDVYRRLCQAQRKGA
jgi:ATP-binding cassette, subfamily B, bacterial MsbA